MRSETKVGTPDRQLRNEVMKRPFSPLLKTCLLFAAFMLVLHVVLWLAVPVWKEADQLREYTTWTTSYLLSKLRERGGTLVSYVSYGKTDR